MHVRRGTFGILSHAPLGDHPLATRREPSVLEGWILEIFYCKPKESKAFMRTFFMEPKRCLRVLGFSET